MCVYTALFCALTVIAVFRLGCYLCQAVDEACVLLEIHRTVCRCDVELVCAYTMTVLSPAALIFI